MHESWQCFRIITKPQGIFQAKACIYILCLLRNSTTLANTCSDKLADKCTSLCTDCGNMQMQRGVNFIQTAAKVYSYYRHFSRLAEKWWCFGSRKLYPDIVLKQSVIFLSKSFSWDQLQIADLHSFQTAWVHAIWVNP